MSRIEESDPVRPEIVERRLGGVPVLVGLSWAQVDRVVRSAAEAGNLSVLLLGLADAREMAVGVKRHLDDARLSRSLLCGLLLLAAFPRDGSSMGNAEASRLLGLGTSTTHRYISTLVAVGLLERDPTTRQYRRTHAG
jgi:hypothetical protein